MPQFEAFLDAILKTTPLTGLVPEVSRKYHRKKEKSF